MKSVALGIIEEICIFRAAGCFNTLRLLCLSLCFRSLQEP